MKEKVVVGMSGGVDSSVAAYLLKEQGYDVIGVTMELWRDEPDVCEDAVEALQICRNLGIEHRVINFKKEFEEGVVNYFIEEYLSGRTPNPCVRCNRLIKWQALLDWAKTCGASYVATGHYARIQKLDNGRITLKKACSEKKDQTYVLAFLSQEQLKHTLIPVGDYEKPKIREIAKNLGLSVAQKKDSQDVCFIDDDYGAFIESRAAERLPGEGSFVLKDGTVVGRHKGIHHYTIGQRKGLNIALGRPVFVSRIDAKKNEVVLGDDEDVFSSELRAAHWNFMANDTLDESKEYIGKIRYSHMGARCSVKKISEDDYLVSFKEPVRAVTPGQTIVLYEDDHVEAGAVIL